MRQADSGVVIQWHNGSSLSRQRDTINPPSLCVHVNFQHKTRLPLTGIHSFFMYSGAGALLSKAQSPSRIIVYRMQLVLYERSFLYLLKPRTEGDDDKR